MLAAALVLLSRVPFVGPGFGLDPDAWRVAWAARTIAATGGYEASRLPGFPVHEMLCAVLSPGGALALAGASALLSAVAAALFVLIWRRVGGRDSLWAALALGFTPAVFLTSVQALDFAWGLAFALGALCLALSGRAWGAGILGGLAIGCRVTGGAWLAPLALALAWSRPPGSRRSAIVICTAAALAVGGLAYLPALLAYRTDLLRYYDVGYPRLLFVIKNLTVDLWGVPGTLALAGAAPIGVLLARRRTAATSIPCERARPLVLGWAIGLGMLLIAYLRLPQEAAYLIPAVPLVLLLGGRFLERRAFLVVCAALVLSPWIVKVSLAGRTDAGASSWGTTTLRLGGQELVVDWPRGPAIVAHARAAQSVGYVDRVLARARQLEGESVVVAWEWLPQIRFRIGGKAAGQVLYTYLLTRDEIADLQARGVAIYDLTGAEAENVKANGISLRDNGARPLLPPDPSW